MVKYWSDLFTKPRPSQAPGVNLARLPILGRNFEYFGEDPYLSGVMAVAEIKAIQSRGLIAMPKSD